MTESEQPQRSAERKIITASELGAYSYCARAWRYQRNHAPNANQKNMEIGARFHRSVWLQITLLKILRAGLILCIAAALILIIWSFWQGQTLP